MLVCEEMGLHYEHHPLLLSLGVSVSQIWWFQIITLTYFVHSLFPSARHGDGLYDSYMRTDHIIKDEADTNGPPGLPPMPKHTVSIHTYRQ